MNCFFPCIYYEELPSNARDILNHLLKWFNISQGPLECNILQINSSLWAVEPEIDGRKISILGRKTLDLLAGGAASYEWVLIKTPCQNGFCLSKLHHLLLICSTDFQFVEALLFEPPEQEWC